MAGHAAASQLAILLEERQNLTFALQMQPYDIILYLRRAVVYTNMGYPDLAIGDAVRAGRLCGELCDYDFVHSRSTYDTLRGYAAGIAAGGQPLGESEILCGMTREQFLAVVHARIESGNIRFRMDEEIRGDPLLPICSEMVFNAERRICQIMAFNLFLCGSLGSAYNECEDGLREDPGNRELLQIKALVETAGRQRLRQSGGLDSEFDPACLPDRGFVRREVYPWNTHEPDRCSPASVASLNEQLAKVAPKCEVRAVQGSRGSAAVSSNCWQLGIFAKEPIAAGEVVLCEYSLLTTSSSHAVATCEACGSDISRTNYVVDKKISSMNSSVSCNLCCALYCSKECDERAQDAYHSPDCNQVDIASHFARDWGPRDASNELYLLLVSRILAMADRQQLHPLELQEVKFLWGDFVAASTNAQNAISSFNLTPYSPEVIAMAAAGGFPPAAWSLPFDLKDHIIRPLLIMDLFGLDVSVDLAKLDVWVINTLFAKLRGTASVRESRRDSPPDVAAVHPLWSLANHDCDPNVTWEWGKCMVLRAKEERVQLADDKAAGTTRPGGIAAGQEILSHYCDVNFPVQLRREWMRGSLGGTCMCQRCQTEAAAEQGNQKPLDTSLAFHAENRLVTTSGMHI
ncbi:hypothetical protein SEPCBS119000_001810 [Sporothrix epigloea]|uniref:SET domain-containing protein n=1 Tax=Sporothrix epigloea TaxID=1892477 RepID=A0ABP0DFT5_9PEZI